MTRKCMYCTKEADYLMQFVASDIPSFYAPGYHVRGFDTFPVCFDCTNVIKEKYVTPVQQKIFVDTLFENKGKK